MCVSSYHPFTIYFHFNTRMATSSTPPLSLRNIRCATCQAVGLHRTRDCPERSKVGVPQAVQEKGVLGIDCLCLDALDPTWIPDGEVNKLVRSHVEAVPGFMQCPGCALIVDDPIWCKACDSLVCRSCLGPQQGMWQCPACDCCLLEDNFFVVGPVQRMAALLFSATARLADPVGCVDSDGEEAWDFAERTGRLGAFTHTPSRWTAPAGDFA